MASFKAPNRIIDIIDNFKNYKTHEKKIDNIKKN